MKKAFELFFSFFKIGAFTLGGGYAMLSMVEKAVVDQKKWIPNDEFWDMIAVVQSLPGVFAVNTALYVGHRVAGTKGAFAAILTLQSCQLQRCFAFVHAQIFLTQSR